MDFRASPFIIKFFWRIGSLVSVKTGHNPFLGGYNLINNGFSFNEMFIDFVAAVTTKFHNILYIFKIFLIYFYVLKDFVFFLIDKVIALSHWF